MVNIASNPAAAASAYGNTAKIANVGNIGNVGGDTAAANAPSFGNFLEDATRSVIGTLKTGEKASAAAVTGTMDPLAITQAVTAARLTLDTVAAIRDAAVDSYNKIQGMPI